MTHTHSNIALVDVPEGAEYHAVEEDRLYVYFAGHDLQYDLPSIGYRFVALSTEMTEEKAREVVVRWGYRHLPIWKDYTNPNDWMPTALESFQSLLTALGCDPAGTYAVLVKEL